MMELDIKFVKQILTLDEKSFKLLITFLPDFKLLQSNYSFDKLLHVIKLIEKKVNKHHIGKTKLTVFIKTYNDLLDELIKNNMLREIVAINQIHYDEFIKFYIMLYNNYEKKDEMLKNLNYFIRFEVKKIIYGEDLDQTQTVCKTPYSIRTFHTDGNIKWYGGENNSDTFKIENANYILSFERYNIGVKNNINLLVNNLLFKKQLPTYNVLFSLDKFKNLDELKKEEKILVKTIKA